MSWQFQGICNDTFRDYEEVYPWVKDRSRRIPFSIIGSKAILYFRFQVKSL